MKKLRIIALIIFCLFLAGCGGSGINYDVNLGLDFSNTKANNMVFKAYHSDTEDHVWKEIASFDINPKNGKSYDISLKASEGKIVISAEEWNSAYKDKEKETYESKTLGATEVFIDEFEGNIPGSKLYGVENISGEQLYQLYPITNGTEASFFEDVSPDKPYDEEGENLDNILITVEIK